jgi:hypothetical protein
LYQNYPNPFNPTTTIQYAIPIVKTHLGESLQHVTLKVYDILGREVTTLVNREQLHGKYKVEFNASLLASGVYIYRLTAGGFSAVKKLSLIK